MNTAGEAVGVGISQRGGGRWLFAGAASGHTCGGPLRAGRWTWAERKGWHRAAEDAGRSPWR